MAFSYQNLVSFLVIIFISSFGAATRSTTEGNGKMIACEIWNEASLSEEDMKNCDHILIDMSDAIYEYDDKARISSSEIDAIRIKKVPNYNVIGYIQFRKEFETDTANKVENMVNMIKEYNFDGIALDFHTNLKNNLRKEYKNVTDAIKEKKIEISMLWTHCGRLVNDNDFFEFMNDFDYFYVLCRGSHTIQAIRDYSLRRHERNVIGPLYIIEYLLEKKIDASRIIYGMNFCVKQYTYKSAINMKTITYEDLCDVWSNENNRSEILFNKDMEADEWIKEKSTSTDFKQKFFFITPDLISTNVRKAKELGLGGVMAHGFECDNRNKNCVGMNGIENDQDKLFDTMINALYTDYPSTTTSGTSSIKGIHFAILSIFLAIMLRYTRIYTL